MGKYELIPGVQPDAQEAALRKYFNAPDGTNTIYVTDEVIIEQLGLDPNDPANYAGGCY